jgi:hypothetical protein
MSKITFNEIKKICIFILSVNILLSLFLFLWVTDDDLNGLPKNNKDRFVSLFYYSITTFTTTGYGDVYAKSNRMKLVSCLYMILIFSVTGSFLFDF